MLQVLHPRNHFILRARCERAEKALPKETGSRPPRCLMTARAEAVDGIGPEEVRVRPAYSASTSLSGGSCATALTSSLTRQGLSSWAGIVREAHEGETIVGEIGEAGCLRGWRLQERRTEGRQEPRRD